MATSDSSRIGKLARRSQTCDICKARHQMCNGARPRCNNCDQRNLNCSYSVAQARGAERPLPITKLPRSPSAFLNAANGKLAISDVQYARLRDQLLDDILRGVYSQSPNAPLTTQVAAPEEHRKDPVQAQVGNASLSSFHQQTSTLINSYVSSNEQSEELRSDVNLSVNDHCMEPAHAAKTRHARKILRDSLPTRDTSQHLLEAFLDFQNSVFYVCHRSEVQEQLNLMYEAAEHVSLAWLCQMFLIFAVGAQFDDGDEEDSAIYHEMGRKYMDDALNEDPENNLWVMRAMLLICFYQPPTKWTTLWIYLDTAIRKAQRHRLDLGRNSSEELTEDEYQEWRQLWLTLISFDRWVAIFLGRLPHINEIMSRDPIFKIDHLQEGLDQSVFQNNITSLAIIMGYILRDMHISEVPDYTMFQQYKTQLETWMRSLPSPIHQHVKYGLIDSVNIPRDQYEAMFNLFFMNLGAWMFLTKPMLSEVVTARATAGDSWSTPILSQPERSTDGNKCVQYAIQLIASSTTLLSIPRSSKRLFMPVYFLVYAAHVVILEVAGTLWIKSENGQPTMSQDQIIKVSALETAIRVLDFCGQRNAFARKYSILIRDLWSQLKRAFSSSDRILAPSMSHDKYQMATIGGTSVSRHVFHGESAGSTSSSSDAHTLPMVDTGQSIDANQILGNGSLLPAGTLDSQGLDLSWPDQLEASDDIVDWSFPEPLAMLQNSGNFGFQEHIWE